MISAKCKDCFYRCECVDDCDGNGFINEEVYLQTIREERMEEAKQEIGWHNNNMWYEDPQ